MGKSCNYFSIGTRNLVSLFIARPFYLQPFRYRLLTLIFPWELLRLIFNAYPEPPTSFDFADEIIQIRVIASCIVQIRESFPEATLPWILTNISIFFLRFPSWQNYRRKDKHKVSQSWSSEWSAKVSVLWIMQICRNINSHRKKQLVCAFSGPLCFRGLFVFVTRRNMSKCYGRLSD